MQNNSEDLIKNNLGLVRSIVAKFCKKGKIEDSEFYSVGCLALVNAAKTFDPNKAKFSTWATRIINQKIISEIRKLKNNKKMQILSTFDSSCGEEILVDRNTKNIPTQLLSVFLPEERDSKQDKENKKLIDLYFLQEKSLSDIGKIMSLSKESIRKKISNAIALLKSKNKEHIDNFNFTLS